MDKSRISRALSLAPEGAHGRMMRVIDAETIGPHGVIVSRAAASQLTSIHTWTLVCETRADVAGVERFTKERVESGTQVAPGMLLVGKESPRLGSDGEVTWISTPLLCPAHVLGQVNVVEMTPTRIELLIRAECPLARGDLLVAGEEAAVVVGIEESQESFVLWPGIAGTQSVEKHASAMLVAHARSTGPVSQLNESPLLGKAVGGGQRLRASHIRLLREHGALFTLHELVTVKSDDSVGRQALLESIARGAPECRADIPNSIQALEATLHSLGFEVSFRAEKITLKLSSEASIRARSRGEILRPETLNAKTHQPTPGGLFDESIFGSRLDREASRSQYGHIELAAPVIHPLFLDEVMLLLGIDAKELRAVMDELRNFAGEETNDWRDTGTTAIADALEAVDLDVVAEEESARGALARRMRASKIHPTAFVFRVWPIAPTGIRPLLQMDDGRWATSDLNDLYRRVINRATRIRRLIEIDAPELILMSESRALQEMIGYLVDNASAEIPLRDEKERGKERPLVSLLDLITGPNALCPFNQLLQRGKTVDFSGAAIAIPCDDLIDHVRVPQSMVATLLQPLIDAESRARMARSESPNLAAIFDDITCDQSLLVVPNRDAMAMASLRLSVWDEHAIGIPVDIYESLHLAPGESVVVHLPLDARAADEVRHWRSHRVPLADEEGGWLERAMRGPTRTVLVDALLRGEVDDVRSELTRLFLGRPPFTTKH